MGGSRSRRKGAQAERDLAKRFAEAMPGAECKRGIGQARRGCEVADVEVPYFHVESKHGKRPNPRAAYAQACADAEESGKGKTPIAVIRDDRRDPFVVIGLDDFLGFVGEWWAVHPDRFKTAAQLAIARGEAAIESSCAAANIGTLASIAETSSIAGDDSLRVGSAVSIEWAVRMAINEQRDES